MRKLTADEKKALLWLGGGVAVLLVLRSMPSLVKSAATGAVNTASQAAGGVAYAAGQATVEAPAQVVGQFAQGIVNTALNPDLNPLHSFGAWLGGAIYDVWHPAQPQVNRSGTVTQQVDTIMNQPAGTQGMGEVRTLRRGPDGVYR